ncbi:hypothetical protein CRBSH125_03090 [Afipia carboxidovorans]|nr:hypothetical protein CRBSH125_03090 [Afipia carboxidovorans]
MRLAADGDAVDAELHLRRDLAQCDVGTLTTGQAVGENADLVPALGLAIGKVKNMADDAANGGADGMQNAEGAIR